MDPNFFIKRPKFAFVISIVITLMGFLSMVVIPVDQYPDITAPKIVVRAFYDGASAETVKNAVASPIEDQVNGAEGMVYMSSKASGDGRYTLTITFDISVDPDLAQVDVQNRVALAEPSLPAEVRRRGITVRKRSPDILMVANLYSPDDRFDGIFLSNYASLNVVGELARIPGVGEASIIGGLDYGMRVWLDPLKLAMNRLSVNQVIAAIREQNVQAAVGQLGGPPNPESTQFQYTLTTQGRLSSPEEFGDIVIRATADGAVTRLRDVARIELGAQGYKGYGEFNNAPGVLIAIYKISDANALEVADRVEAKLDELSAFFPEGVAHKIGHDTTLFIRESLEETVLTLFFTIALVVFVTYLFLGNARATLIPTLAVPVSIIGTIAVLYALGMTINTVTLFALILAIGIVVDDAILVVENVERLMSEQHLPAPAATAAAMKEVAAPIVATSLVLLAVFGPTMLLPGITGEMFKQFGTTLVVAVLISMVNALTLSPALSASFLKHSESRPNILIRGFERFLAGLTTGYSAIVDWLTNRLAVGVAVIVGLFAVLFLLFGQLATSFIPEEDKGFFFVDVQLPDAASLNRTVEVMDEIVELLKQDPAIETVLSVNGYSLLNTSLQPNAGMVIAKLKPWSERKSPELHQFALQRKYQARLGGIPEMRALVFGAPAIPGLGAVAGFSFVLEDTIGKGPDDLAAVMNTLISQATERDEILRAFSTFRPGSPQIELEVDRVKAKTLGVSVADIFLTLQAQLGGYYVNDFNLFNKSYKVMVQADAPYRQQELDLRRYYVSNASGGLVPLTSVVTAKPSLGPDILNRYNTYDSVTISGIPNVAGGYSSGAAMLAMEETAAEVLPEGYKFEWTNSSFEEKKSGNMMPIVLALSTVFVYLFLAALYESFLTPFAIILSVPIAIIGAAVALLVMNQPLSLYGQIGLVMLIGMASKTAILVVEFGKELRETEKLSLAEATTKAARLRFRPVLMTSLAFAVGVIPLVVASGAGAASRVSLGLVAFGGMIMATIGGTLLVPIFFKIVQGLREYLHGGPTRSPDETDLEGA
ncbi:MAG: multidrug efflux RND transporter permease subunit [Woeseiaceae bacterium]|nr:multidrug efflux RND transporter permease subunit [Woeseiaceae bacterium]